MHKGCTSALNRNVYILLYYYTTMERKTTSLKIDTDLWRKVKKHCIDQNIDISEYLEEVIRRDFVDRMINKK